MHMCSRCALLEQSRENARDMVDEGYYALLLVDGLDEVDGGEGVAALEGREDLGALLEEPLEVDEGVAEADFLVLDVLELLVAELLREVVRDELEVDAEVLEVLLVRLVVELDVDHVVFALELPLVLVSGVMGE